MSSAARNFTGLAIFTAIMVAVLTGLGLWQIERLGAKAELLQRIETRIAAAPVPLPDETQWRDPDENIDYKKVTVSGTFRHDQETYLFGAIDKNERGDNVPGFFVLTPLVLESGAVVIVNRGFVPQDLKDPAKRGAAQSAGKVGITGLLRLPERKTLFTPDADQAKRVLYARDPALIAQWFDMKRVAPFSLDADGSPNPGGWPLGGQTIVSVPNNHLQYAITWFALALVTSAMFAVYALRRGKDDAS